MVKDVTYCNSKDCPSKDCSIKVSNNDFKAGDIVSMADFSGVCRYYIGWLISEVEEEI